MTAKGYVEQMFEVKIIDNDIIIIWLLLRLDFVSDEIVEHFCTISRFMII